MRKKICGKRAIFNRAIVCTLPKNHKMPKKGGHWGPWRDIPGANLKVRSGFCHAKGERCHHL